MPNLPLPPAQDFPRLWRSSPKEREEALVKHYESNPGWGYGPTKRVAPKLVSGELSLVAALGGIRKIRHDVARQQNIEAVETLFTMIMDKGVLCFKPPTSFLELGRDARLKVRADIAYLKKGVPHLILLQVRKLNALSSPFEISAWGSLAGRALRIGDFREAILTIWDVSAPEKDAPRKATRIDLASRPEMPDADLDALVNDILSTRQALIDKGYVRPARERHPKDEKPTDPPLPF